MPGDFVKCPRCDLNYIRRGEEYCEVCKAELKGQKVKITVVSSGSVPTREDIIEDILNDTP